MAGGEGEGEERSLFLMSQETAQLITYEGQITDNKLSTAERNKIPMWTIKASMWWKGQRFLIEQAAWRGPWRPTVDAWLSGRPGGERFLGPSLLKLSRHFWGWQAALWALFSSHVLLTAELLATNLKNTWGEEESGWGSRAKAPWAIRYLCMLPATETGWRRAEMTEVFLPFFFLKIVNFPHHHPDVEVQISTAGSWILWGAWSEISLLSAHPP